MTLLLSVVSETAAFYCLLDIHEGRFLYCACPGNPPSFAPGEPGIEIAGIEYVLPFHLILHYTKVCEWNL